MKIAAITITYNDDYKYNEWLSYYNEYRNFIYKHIIVDNGSSIGYINKVKKDFTKSIIIEREINGGTTSAYNDGIRLALLDKNVDSIMLIGNDIRIIRVKRLYEFLFSNDKYGMVAPIMLQKDSENIIDDYGCAISYFLNLKPKYVGNLITSSMEKNRIVSTVTGGMNLAKREFYEQVGLQDESLFMYSDEVDMGIRAKKMNFLIAVTRETLSWHQHINPSGKKNRAGYTQYLIRRNKIYLTYKHYSIFRVIAVFLYQILYFPRMLMHYISTNSTKLAGYYLLGALMGLIRNNNNYNFIVNNKS